jgi:hypothetical protein
MKLLDHIKRDRVRQKGKQPLPETVLEVVAAIVQKFDLSAVPEGEGGDEEPYETKPGGRLSLFPLVSAAQWRLTKDIVEKYDNPYLVYARSPEDFGLSRRLYERYPDLTVEVFEKYSLGALWLREMAGEREKMVQGRDTSVSRFTGWKPKTGNQKP